MGCLVEFETGVDTTGTITLVGTAKHQNSAVSFKLYNDGNDDETVKVYVAFYKDGEFCGAVAHTDAVSVASKGEADVSVSAGGYTEFDSVRVYVWDSILTPLMSVYSRNIAAAAE